MLFNQFQSTLKFNGLKQKPANLSDLVIIPNLPLQPNLDNNQKHKSPLIVKRRPLKQIQRGFLFELFRQEQNPAHSSKNGRQGQPEKVAPTIGVHATIFG